MLDLIFTKTPLAFFIQNLWRDEAFSYLLAKRSIWEILSLTARDSNPPLYYIILHFWSLIFGKSEIALRSLSLLFFWLTGYMLYKILNDVFHIPFRRIIIYIALYAVNPLFIYYAFEVRMYSMFAFFSAWSFYAFLKKDKKQFFWATFFNLYTHYFGMIVLGVQLLMVMLGRGIKLPRINRSLGNNLRRFIAYAKYKPLTYFLPWLIFMLAVNRNDTGSFWLKPIKESWLYAPAHLFSGYSSELNFLNSAPGRYLNFYTVFSFFMIFILCAGYFFHIRRRQFDSRPYRFFLIMFLFPVVFTLTISLIRPIFLSRYMIFSSVALLILIFLAVEQAPFPANLFCILVILIFSLYYNKLEVQYRTKTSFSRTVAEVKAIAKPADVIYVDDELNFHTMEYYFGEDKVYVFGKTYGEIPWYVGKVLIPADRITSRLPAYPKKAFIINGDGRYEIKSIL